MTSSERDVEEEEVHKDNSVWKEHIEENFRSRSDRGDQEEDDKYRVSMTVTHVNALARAKKSSLGIYKSHKVKSENVMNTKLPLDGCIYKLTVGSILTTNAFQTNLC